MNFKILLFAAFGFFLSGCHECTRSQSFLLAPIIEVSVMLERTPSGEELRDSECDEIRYKFKNLREDSKLLYSGMDDVNEAAALVDQIHDAADLAESMCDAADTGDLGRAEFLAWELSSDLNWLIAPVREATIEICR